MPLPGLRLRFTGTRNGPEAPGFLARRLIVGGDETAHAFVAARCPGHDEIADDERRAGRVVILAPVGHLGFPDQRPRKSIERDDVRVIGDHEQAIARDRHAAVDAARGVPDETLGSWTAIVPDFAARARVEGIALVRGRHIHDAVHDHRRHLQAR
jgi:hypothetical protein